MYIVAWPRFLVCTLVAYQVISTGNALRVAHPDRRAQMQPGPLGPPDANAALHSGVKAIQFLSAVRSVGGEAGNLRLRPIVLFRARALQRVTTVTSSSSDQ